MLQFGKAERGVDYVRRPTAFGLVLYEERLACVRVERADRSYYDLPGGAIDGRETEEQALVREFVEETGMQVRPIERIAEAAQYFRRSEGAPFNNVAGFWIAQRLSLDPAAKTEADHELVWLTPHQALNELRHDAHAWAVAVWLRRRSRAGGTAPQAQPLS